MEDQLTRKESPLALNYVKMWKIFAGVMAAWPNESGKGKVSALFKVYSWIYCVTGTLMAAGVVNYIRLNYQKVDFMTRGHLYLTLFSGTVTIIRCVVPHLENYNRVAHRLFSEAHLIHFKHKNEYCLKVNNLVDRISYYCTVCMVANTFLATIIFNIPAFYENYQKGIFTGERRENSTISYSVYYSVPGLDPEKMLIPYTVLNIIAVYAASAFTYIIDLYLMLFGFQIIGHLYILKHDLENLSVPKNKGVLQFNDFTVSVDMYDDEENKQIYKAITGCINYHRLIISFTDDLSTLFGPSIATSYLFHLLACCVALLQCLSGDPSAIVTYCVYTVAVFSQLCYISVLFEVLGAMSERLIAAVYAVPWECMDVPNRRVVLMLLRRVQRPIRIRALGMADVGFPTMVGILKATFSYYTFFSSFK